MPESFTTDGVTEKNKLTATGVWLLLATVEYPSETPVRVVLNNEDITWPSSGGDLYHAAEFSLGPMSQSQDGALPTVDLSIWDLDGRLKYHLDEYDGGTGATVTIDLVHSDHLDNTDAEMERTYQVLTTNVSPEGLVTFRLGSANLLLYRTPQDRYLKDHCRYEEFKGSLCKYSGGQTECDRTFTQCIAYGNEANFGGFPGIGGQGFFGDYSFFNLFAGMRRS